MERQTLCRVRGLDSAATAHRVENALFASNGIHEAHADPETGRVWVRYDAAKVPPQRLRGYLLAAGVEPV